MYGTSPIELLACQAMLERLVYLDNFTYSCVFTAPDTTLGANGTAKTVIQINGDSDFVIQEMNLVAYSAGPVLIADPDYLINLVTAGSGREIMNQEQHVGAYMGNYQSNHVPGKVTMPKLLQAKQAITVALTNLTATAALRVDVAFKGFKVFYVKNPVTGKTGTRENVFHAL